MNKVIVWMLAAVVLSTSISCQKVIGTGPVETETRNEKNFDAIAVSICGEVIYRDAPDFKVQVQAQRNILDVLETFVSGSELVLKFRNNVRVRSHEDINVIVEGPGVSSFKISGSGNLHVAGAIQTNMLHASISGSGNITVDHSVGDHLEANISGSGYIRVISGSMDSENLRISGSGDMDLSGLMARKVTTTTSGSGAMRLFATERLEATISGSGSVYYLGNPVISTHISGSGKIKPL